MPRRYDSADAKRRILYDNTALTAEAVIRRDWNTKTSYDLVSNVAVTDVG